MSFTIEKIEGRNKVQHRVYSKSEVDLMLRGIFDSSERRANALITNSNRLHELNEKLDDLNNVQLPALQGELDTLDGYFQDPSTIPAGYTFFEGIVSNDIWAQNVVAMQGWFDNIIANTLFVDRITANHIAADTITANEIAAGTITSTEINVADLFAQTITVTGSIESDNFLTGSAGWRINSVGNAEFNDVIVRGTGSTITGDAVLGDLTIDGTLTIGSSGKITNESNTYIISESGPGATPEISINSSLATEGVISKNVVWRRFDTDAFVASIGSNGASGLFGMEAEDGVRYLINNDAGTGYPFGHRFYVNPAPPLTTATPQLTIIKTQISTDVDFVYKGIRLEDQFAGGTVVSSVFGRTGDVVAQSGDYDSFYVPSTGGTFTGTVAGVGFQVNQVSGFWFNAKVTDDSSSGIFRGIDSGDNIVSQIVARDFNGAGGGHLEFSGDWKFVENTYAPDFILT